MFNIQQIPRILTSLITELALTMPVAFIRNIRFYNDGALVADCNWVLSHESHAKIFDENQPAYITFKKNFNNFTDIEVSAIDAEGRELRIRPMMSHFTK